MCFLKTDRCQDSKNWYIFRLNTFDQTYFEIVFCHSLIKTEIENEEKKRTAYGQLVNGYLCCFVRLFKHKTILSRCFLILQTPFVLFFILPFIVLWRAILRRIYANGQKQSDFSISVFSTQIHRTRDEREKKQQT